MTSLKSNQPTCTPPAGTIKPRTLWFTGLSGAGKSTLSLALQRQLAERLPITVLDGDELRQNLCADLGFSEADRTENIRRIAQVARLMNKCGLTVLVATISPQHSMRSLARDIIGAEHFTEVYLSTPLDICEARDPKGLYQRARSGRLQSFTGIDAPYEPPVAADLTIETEQEDMKHSLARLARHLLAGEA
ncbi:adenylyl-sulfate kinase [Pseudomonas vanderleydeniana]|uniref:Adenylyl-sulfate kinase n=1 Tax=Pseudomonas vanderleydeniana TaxID=2745495 RepID=A0A9E6PGN5_9PSED|nr:adenylyl-sulfate kinase [Pseudomonas vanderleydeniana]QXI26094.1 adenylyl-sulfate kinase [Pseudomonas vanderleydeniana]